MTIIRKHLILIAALLITTSCFAQDRLGFKFSTIVNTALNAKGVVMTISGDSLIQLTNKAAGRFFTYQFDKLTHVCISENIQINHDDKRNIKAFVHYVRRTKPQTTVVAKGITIFQNKTEKVVMSEQGESVEFSVSSEHSTDNT